MRFARISMEGQVHLALASGKKLLATSNPEYCDLDSVLSGGARGLMEAAKACSQGRDVSGEDFDFIPPFHRPSKIVCIGLNYLDHASESGFEVPDYPTIFARFPSSLVGHNAPIIKSPLSDKLDFEGEMVAVVGKSAKQVPVSSALEYVAGYSIFNDASVRDFQLRTTQWTAGKNFDGTGGFGPWFVTADELPPGASPLKIETRLNGQVVQSASTQDMIFDIAKLVSILSSFMTLEIGDLIVTGTPSGVGMSRTPPLFMNVGDICEVEIEGIGLLRNPISYR